MREEEGGGGEARCGGEEDGFRHGRELDELRV